MSTNRQVRAAEERANRSLARYKAASTTIRGIKDGRKGTWRNPDSVVSGTLKQAVKDTRRSQRVKDRRK